MSHYAIAGSRVSSGAKGWVAGCPRFLQSVAGKGSHVFYKEASGPRKEGGLSRYDAKGTARPRITLINCSGTVAMIEHCLLFRM